MQIKILARACLTLALLLTACNFRSAPETPTPESFANPERTIAAQTIVAQLTKISLPTVDPTSLALTPSATLGIPTATLIPPEPAQLTLTAFSVATAAAETTSAAAAAVTTTAPTAGEGEEVSETTAAETAPTDASATPAATAAPTLTTVAGDPILSLGQPDWEDTFSSGENWALYSDEFASFTVSSGTLTMTAFQTGARNSWMLASPRLQDYYLEVTARPQECSGLDRYGIIFRSDANVGYLFGFSCSGQYSLRRWNGVRAAVLVDWTSSPSIIPGANETNRMGLRVEGGDFSLYANGGLLTEVTDNTLVETGFGLFIGAENTEDFSVEVDRVAYWELP